MASSTAAAAAAGPAEEGGIHEEVFEPHELKEMVRVGDPGRNNRRFIDPRNGGRPGPGYIGDDVYVHPTA